MTAPSIWAWPLSWKIAAAVALESGLDWARWAYGLDCHWEEPVTPVPAPWDAEAYRADCVRRKVDPGPMPALEFSIEPAARGVGWRIASWGDGEVVMIVYLDGRRAATWHSRDSSIRFDWREYSLNVVNRISALATAAARAIGLVRVAAP